MWFLYNFRRTFYATFEALNRVCELAAQLDTNFQNLSEEQLVYRTEIALRTVPIMTMWEKQILARAIENWG